ncbi:MAG: DM13 domain-containing protein, partial [Rhodothermales bacterium]|nr:DM13 domain-containing protein [Rhodothermales bacterium]
MKNRKVIILSVSIVVAFVGWLLFRPERIFIDRTVDESFPVEAASSAKASVTLLEGRFHDVAHATRGTAVIHQLADGKRVLRFTGFETSNGPDVQVYLGKAPDALDNETVTRAGFF